MTITRSRLPAFASCDTKHGETSWIRYQEDDTPQGLTDLKLLAIRHADENGHTVDLYMPRYLHITPRTPKENEAA